MLHQILLVAFLDSLGDHTAADKTTVDKIDLEVTVGTHQYRFAQISFDFDAVLFDLDRHQLCGDLPAVDPVNYLPQVTVSGGMESGLVLQKLVLSHEGDAKESYFGPTESGVVR